MAPAFFAGATEAEAREGERFKRDVYLINFRRGSAIRVTDAVEAA